MISTNLRMACFKLCLLALPCFLAGAPVFAQGDDPPARVARVSYLSGNVSLEPSGENQWSQLSLNYPATTGDRLYTDQDSRAELDLGTSAVRMSGATDLTVANLTDQLLQLGLAQGTIRVRVYELPPGTSVEVDTPNGALTLQAPGDYRVDTYPQDNTTMVSVNVGSLELSGGNLSGTVNSGQAIKLTGADPIQVMNVSLLGPDDFDQWSRSRDHAYEAAASARYVSRGIPGYEDLDSNGSWANGPGGPVWYPNGVAADWVPYRNGHWVWVSPWGWTWVAGERWGFAPFHYGRWAFIGARWGWVPGPFAVRPYYAPALVAFVGGGGLSVGIGIGGVQAWFPLGPGEPFNPWYHCGDRYRREVNVTNIRNVTNITNITNVNNYSNIHYVNQRVATTAVPSQAFRSGQSVAPVAVRINPQEAGRARLIPHPGVAPTAGAVMMHPVKTPPVRAERFTQAAREARVAQPPVRLNQHGSTTPYRPATPPPNRPAPPTGQRAYTPPLRNTPPSQAAGRQPAYQGNPPASSGQAPARLITRTPPPPTKPSFEARKPALDAHPGRPLEPQQVQNLRRGRSAGPMRDREYPPHPQASRPAPREANRPAPAAQQRKDEHGR